MSQLPRLKVSQTCPRCSGQAVLDAPNRRFACPTCGFTFDARQPSPRPSADSHAVMRITHRGEVNTWARAAFETAQYAILRGNRADAETALKRALDNQPDFADAHLWLARLNDDPAVKRDHLSSILAHMPNHLDALREMMVLNGQLTPEQAANTHHFNDPELRRADAPVTMRTSVLRCPVCQGDLTVTDDGHVECRFCGYQAERALAAPEGDNLLGMALLERKAQRVRWQIGGRLLHCNQCGAERTIPATALSTRCPFCDSTHVVVQDALDTFEQPDSLMPFLIDEAQAEAAIRDALGGLTERLRGLFDRNAIRALTLEGVYLPLWVFDVMADVTQTITPRRDGSRYQTGPLPQVQQTTFRDGVYNVPIPATTTPAQIEKLVPFDFSAAVAYKPRLLARYPAALYSIDFDRASLDVRSQAIRLMEIRHKQGSGDDQITVFTNVAQMSFRLMLAPVWVASLQEVDGDVRQALVNGQTGRCVLGKTR